MDDKEYLTIPQAAEKVGIGVKKMRDLIRNGDMPAIRWGHRTIRIDSSNLEEVIADLTIGGSNR